MIHSLYSDLYSNGTISARTYWPTYLKCHPLFFLVYTTIKHNIYILYLSTMVYFTFLQLESKLHKSRRVFFLLFCLQLYSQSTSDHKLVSLTSTSLFLINYFFDFIKNSSSLTFIHLQILTE